MTRTLALLTLALAPTIASGDCAWIVWKETDLCPTCNASTSVWTLYRAEETKRDCEGAAGRLAKYSFDKVGPSGPGVKKEREGWRIKTLDASGKEIRSELFWCLPSGTDPRP